MADVNAVISLGLGTPADIPHFLLVGLSINDDVAADEPSVVAGLSASFSPAVTGLTASYAPTVTGLTASVE